MAVIDMTGFDTQANPMAAIESIIEDCNGGFLSAKEAVTIINAVVTEWRQ